jgi:alpha-glucosidase
MYELLAGSALVAAASALAIAPRQTNDTSCPGYSASNVEKSGTGLSADLSLAGSPCNSYGKDIENLRLTVSYDTCTYADVHTISARC